MMNDLTRSDIQHILTKHVFNIRNAMPEGSHIMVIVAPDEIATNVIMATNIQCPHCREQLLACVGEMTLEDKVSETKDH